MAGQNPKAPATEPARLPSSRLYSANSSSSPSAWRNTSFDGSAMNRNQRHQQDLEAEVMDLRAKRDELTRLQQQLDTMLQGQQASSSGDEEVTNDVEDKNHDADALSSSAGGDDDEESQASEDNEQSDQDGQDDADGVLSMQELAQLPDNVIQQLPEELQGAIFDIKNQYERLAEKQRQLQQLQSQLQMLQVLRGQEATGDDELATALQTMAGLLGSNAEGEGDDEEEEDRNEDAVTDNDGGEEGAMLRALFQQFLGQAQDAETSPEDEQERDAEADAENGPQQNEEGDVTEINLDGAEFNQLEDRILAAASVAMQHSQGNRHANDLQRLLVGLEEARALRQQLLQLKALHEQQESEQPQVEDITESEAEQQQTEDTAQQSESQAQQEPSQQHSATDTVNVNDRAASELTEDQRLLEKRQQLAELMALRDQLLSERQQLIQERAAEDKRIELQKQQEELVRLRDQLDSLNEMKQALMQQREEAQAAQRMALGPQVSQRVSWQEPAEEQQDDVDEEAGQPSEEEEEAFEDDLEYANKDRLHQQLQEQMLMHHDLLQKLERQRNALAAKQRQSAFQDADEEAGQTEDDTNNAQRSSGSAQHQPLPVTDRVFDLLGRVEQLRNMGRNVIREAQEQRMRDTETTQTTSSEENFGLRQAELDEILRNLDHEKGYLLPGRISPRSGSVSLAPCTGATTTDPSVVAEMSAVPEDEQAPFEDDQAWEEPADNVLEELDELDRLEEEYRATLENALDQTYDEADFMLRQQGLMDNLNNVRERVLSLQQQINVTRAQRNSDLFDQSSMWLDQPVDEPDQAQAAPLPVVEEERRLEEMHNLKLAMEYSKMLSRSERHEFFSLFFSRLQEGPYGAFVEAAQNYSLILANLDLPGEADADEEDALSPFRQNQSLMDDEQVVDALERCIDVHFDQLDFVTEALELLSQMDSDYKRKRCLYLLRDAFTLLEEIDATNVSQSRIAIENMPSAYSSNSEYESTHGTRVDTEADGGDAMTTSESRARHYRQLERRSGSSASTKDWIFHYLRVGDTDNVYSGDFDELHMAESTTSLETPSEVDTETLLRIAGEYARQPATESEIHDSADMGTADDTEQETDQAEYDVSTEPVHHQWLEAYLQDDTYVDHANRATSEQTDTEDTTESDLDALNETIRHRPKVANSEKAKPDMVQQVRAAGQKLNDTSETATHDSLLHEFSGDLYVHAVILQQAERVLTDLPAGILVDYDIVDGLCKSIEGAMRSDTSSNGWPEALPDELESELTASVRGVMNKFIGNPIDDCRTAALQDLDSLLYDEMIFNKVVEQVDKSYQKEMAELHSAQAELLREEQSLTRERKATMLKLAEDRRHRLLTLIAGSQDIESPKEGDTLVALRGGDNRGITSSDEDHEDSEPELRESQLTRHATGSEEDEEADGSDSLAPSDSDPQQQRQQQQQQHFQQMTMTDPPTVTAMLDSAKEDFEHLDEELTDLRNYLFQEMLRVDSQPQLPTSSYSPIRAMISASHLLHPLQHSARARCVSSDEASAVVTIRRHDKSGGTMQVTTFQCEGGELVLDAAAKEDSDVTEADVDDYEASSCTSRDQQEGRDTLPSEHTHLTSHNNDEDSNDFVVDDRNSEANEGEDTDGSEDAAADENVEQENDESLAQLTGMAKYMFALSELGEESGQEDTASSPLLFSESDFPSDAFSSHGLRSLLPMVADVSPESENVRGDVLADTIPNPDEF
eukprot:m.127546 g.127546  ORF g.127546 m.127546 type:complete len:1720 (-) comp15660_c0_seq1:252-5411(-)